MSPRYQIKYEPLAQSALEEAAAHIRDDSGPERAARWLRSILASLDKLETLPKAFGIWTQRGGQPVYSKPVPPYRAFYVVDESTLTVHVIDVVHTARETRLAAYRHCLPTEVSGPLFPTNSVSGKPGAVQSAVAVSKIAQRVLAAFGLRYITDGSLEAATVAPGTTPCLAAPRSKPSTDAAVRV